MKQKLNTQKEISKIATWKWLPTNDLSSILFLIRSKVPPKKKAKVRGVDFHVRKKDRYNLNFSNFLYILSFCHTTKTHRNMYNKRSELNFVFNWFWGTTKKKGKPAGIIFMLAQQSVLCRIFEFQNSKFWMKITPCGFTCRYAPFFQQWNSFTFRLTCLFYTFLSLSGCN